MAAASSRRIATASSVTGSASAGRPSSENRMPRLVSEGRGRGGSGRVGGGQLPADRHRLLGHRQRVGRAGPAPRTGRPGWTASRRGRGGNGRAWRQPAPGRSPPPPRPAAARRPPGPAPRTGAEVGQRGGEVGAVAVGEAAASSRRIATASSVTGSASAGRPSSEKVSPRLDSETARSGR